MDAIDVIAHRGSQDRGPDNSVAAIAGARNDGATWVEVDVRLTRDGIAVLSHDEEVSDLSIPTSNLDALKSVDPEIATLSEGLEAAMGLGVNLEFKGPIDDIAPLLRAIQVLEDFAGETLFSSFWPEILNSLRRALPERDYGVLSSPTYDPDGSLALKLAQESGFGTALPHDQAIDKSLVEKAKRAEVQIVAWTVNDAFRMNELKDFGVKGIITDDPRKAARVLNG